MNVALMGAEGPLEAPIRSLLQRLLRHKLMILLIFACGTGAAIAFVQRAPPRYRAQVVLAVGTQGHDLLSNERQQNSGDQPTTTAAVWAEVTRLQSWTLAN